MATIVRSFARMLQRAPVAAGGLSQLRRHQASSGPCRASRLMSSSTMRHIRREAPATLSLAMEEIQMHKEELYDLLVEAGLTDRVNRQLLRSLSEQIKPRPNDYKWRWTRAVQFTQVLVKPIIPLTGSLLLIFATFEQHVTKTVADEKKRQQAETAAKQENLPSYHAEENLPAYARGATSV